MADNLDQTNMYMLLMEEYLCIIICSHPYNKGGEREGG